MKTFIDVKNHYFVKTHLSVELDLSSAEYDKRNITCSPPKIAVFRKPNDPDCWLAKLKLELTHAADGTKSLYTGELLNAGEFRLSPEVPEKDRHDYVIQSTGAILYSAMREWVATLTARSLHGMVELPTFDSRSFLPPKPKPPEPPPAPPESKEKRKRPKK